MGNNQSLWWAEVLLFNHIYQTEWTPEKLGYFQGNSEKFYKKTWTDFNLPSNDFS